MKRQTHLCGTAILTAAALPLMAAFDTAVTSNPHTAGGGSYLVRGAVDGAPTRSGGLGFELFGTAALPDGTPLSGTWMLAVARLSEPAVGEDENKTPGSESRATNLIAAGSAISGDLNGDGVVDLVDVSVLLESLGPVGPDAEQHGLSADLNGDGFVDRRDLILLLTLLD